MMEKLQKLMEEKKLYEQDDSNLVLQAKELESIARAMLEVSKDATGLTAEELSAVQWAKKRLGVA